MIRQCQHRFFRHYLLQSFERPLTSICPIPRSLLFQHIHERNSDVRISPDKPPIVVSEDKEQTQLRYLCWRLPLGNSLNFGRASANSSIPYNGPQKWHFPLSKSTLLALYVQIIIPQNLENLFDMLDVFLERSAVKHNVVQLNHNKSFKKWVEYLIHQCAECSQCIRQAKWHDKELI